MKKYHNYFIISDVFTVMFFFYVIHACMKMSIVRQSQSLGYLDGCIVLNKQNTVFASKSAIRAKAVYFLHSTMPNVTCLRLSDVSVICRVTYFQFISLFFFHIGRQAYWF